MMAFDTVGMDHGKHDWIGVMKKSKVNYVEGQDTRQHHITGVALDGLTMEREKGLHAHIKYNYHNDINKSKGDVS
jgi:hypothetical protein